MSEYEDLTPSSQPNLLTPQMEDFTVIIDIGEAYTKVGFAGDEAPRSIFPTITGREKYKNVMVDVGAHTKQIYVGKDCMHMRGVLKINYPISRGQIMDWDSYFAILTHIFYNELRIDPSKANVIYAENPMTPLATRQYIARVLFETYKAKTIYIAASPILALFSAGLTTGIVIESGEGLTCVTPIINGQIVFPAVQQLYLAGADVQENLKSWLLRTGIKIAGTSAEREILREIKEKNCFISLNPNQVIATPKDSNPYVMPDGETVSIGMDVRVNAPEILFHPEILGYNTFNIPQAVIECLKRVDRTYWRTLLKNIVISGGNTMFYGLETRLEQEINNLLYDLGPLPEQEPAQPAIKQPLITVETVEKTADTCPQCGTRVDLTVSKTCPQCGADMSGVKINIPSTVIEKYPEKCEKCGKKLKEESPFCPYCGSKIEKIILDTKKIKIKPIEVPPTISEFEASEFSDTGDSGDKKVIKIIIPENRATAIFNGASVLGALDSFKKLFVNYERFIQDPNCIESEFSQIL